MPFKDKAVKKAYDRARYDANVEFLREYKLIHGCADCGYNENHAGLEFDHRDGAEKFNNVSSMTSGTLEYVMAEVKKCDVVCGTCHNIRTFNRRHGE